MQILVTGGAGFIGSHLSERLISDGHSVTVLDDLSTGRIENLNALQSDKAFSFTRGSVLDAALVERLVGNSDVIFHLAAAVGVKVIMEQPSQSILTNVIGTENVLKAAIPDGRLTFIASSSEVYGKSAKFPLHEDDDLTTGATLNLRWSYACAKTLDEFLALAYARDVGLPVIVTRLFNTTGPRQTGRYGMVVPNFVNSALAGEPLLVHGTGKQSRCFGHVLDVIEALVRLMAAPDVTGQVYNIGNDQEITIMALAEQVVAATGSASEIRLIPYEDVYPVGFEDMERRLPDVTKLEKAISFRPTRSLANIISDILEQRRSQSAA